MERFFKVPKSIWELGLTTNELIVVVRLLYVEDYRTYKGEINEGWFIKSKSELSRECGFEDRHRLYRTLDKLQDKGIIEIFAKKNAPARFKINHNNMVQNTPLEDNDTPEQTDMVQNTPYTMVQNEPLDMVQNEPFHKTLNIKTDFHNTRENIINNKNILENKDIEENIEIKEDIDIKEEKDIEQTVSNPSVSSSDNSNNMSIEEIIEDYTTKGGRFTVTEDIDSFIFKNSKPLYDINVNYKKMFKNDFEQLFQYVSNNN